MSFINLFRLAFGDANKSIITNRLECPAKVGATAPGVKAKAVKRVCPLEADIRKLEEMFGPLCEGKLIEITLQDAIKLMPRDRKRCDAYNRLCWKLKNEYGTILKIKSQKSKEDRNEKWSDL